MKKHPEQYKDLANLVIEVAKAILFITIGILVGFLIGKSADQQINKVKTIESEPEIKIITQEKTGELIYYQCKHSISSIINPWNGNVSDYPVDDFMKLVDQCVNYSNKDTITKE